MTKFSDSRIVLTVAMRVRLSVTRPWSGGGRRTRRGLSVAASRSPGRRSSRQRVMRTMMTMTTSWDSTPALYGRQSVVRSASQNRIRWSKHKIIVWKEMKIYFCWQFQDPPYKCECVQGYVPDPQVWSLMLISLLSPAVWRCVTASLSSDNIIIIW